MPGQRRLAVPRLRVPNLDGFVVTAAGNLFSIGTPRHKLVDPEIVRSQDTNQQKQREEKFGEKELEKRKTYELECPISVDSTNPVRASQTTTRHPSARASLDPSGEKATASISTPPRIVNLHARRHCRGLTRSMKARMAGVFSRWTLVCVPVGAGRNVQSVSCDASCSTKCNMGKSAGFSNTQL